MGTPLKAYDQFNPDTVSQGNVYQLLPTQAAVNTGVNAILPALKGFKNTYENNDHKLLDYLLIGVFSILVHNNVIDHFKGVSFEQPIVEPVKEQKVTITFTRPQPPKPVPPPPVVKPAPPPVQKLVPIKPPKPKLVPKVQPVVSQEPTPVVETTQVAAPSAPPAPPAPVVEEKITPPVASGDYLHNPPPEYPDAAADRGWTGKVILRVHVLTDGKAGEVRVHKTSGYKILDEAAAKAVSKWSFSPAKRGDTPIDFWYDVPINFV